ncbi:MAG: SDR family oxidoreductase [Pseudomonadota bacterium]
METVLVTGAARGIGLALVKHFCEAGLSVIATHRGEPGAELAMLVDSHGVRLHALDVVNEQAVAELGEALADETLDLLINNAGVIGPGREADDPLTAERWLDTFRINTLSPLWVSQALFAPLKRSGNPRVVTVSSQMGSLQHGGTGLVAYRSSKAALNKVMHVLSQEWREHNITVCPIHPGWVRTDMGGDAADISPDESAAGIVKLALSLTLEQSGTFYTWDGRVHPW